MPTSKSLYPLWIQLYKLISPKIDVRTIKTLEKRACSEPNFLTVLLPSFGKSVDRSLNGQPFSTPAFFKTKAGIDTVLPSFLYELTSLIYDDFGYIKSHDYVKELRQLLFLFYKYETIFTREQEIEAYDKFINTDKLVMTGFSPIREHLRDVFARALPEDPFDIRPSHSNGATQLSFINNSKKRDMLRYIPRLHTHYRASYFNTHAFNYDVSPINDIPGRLALVPKDSRGPRIICIEPHETMLIQQGLMRSIYDWVENYSDFKGHINFSDQSVNADLAYTASVTTDYATIDLKDASDLVSWDIILDVVPEAWRAALIATRTESISVPDGRTVVLKKFAPMGSALCFPIEAIYFYAICSYHTKDVYVYGDDIICPTSKVDAIISSLTDHGLIVNVDKTLTHGHFRESCGAEYLNGIDITCVKYRKADFLSFVSFCNNIADKFGDHVGLSLCDWYNSTNHDKIPIVNNKARFYPGVYYTSGPTRAFVYAFTSVRGNNFYQVDEYRLLSAYKTVKIEQPTDDGLYYDFLYTGSSSPLQDYENRRLLKDVEHHSNKVDFMKTCRTSSFSKPTNKIGRIWANLFS